MMNRRISSLALVSAMLLAGCPEPKVVSCDGNDRPRLECSSEIEYQGLSGKGGVKLFDAVGLESAFEKKALRQASEALQQYVAQSTRNCRDYNACLLSASEYRQRSDEIRDKAALVPAAMKALEGAQSSKERLAILDRLYRGVVPDEQRTAEVTFTLRVAARLPANLGGGPLVVRQNSEVPTGATMHFEVRVDTAAYLYLFQVKPTGEVNVLFPNPAVSGSNPLAARKPSRIPKHGKTFRVNDEDLGVEKVYFVVSRHPVKTMDAAVAKVLGGQATKISDDPWLADVAKVVPGDDEACDTRALELVDEAGCRADRGLEIVGDAASTDSPEAASLVAVTDPGDDTIVKVLAFKHVAGGSPTP